MTLDLSYVEKALKTTMPPSALPSLEQLRRTDLYVRAYYFPWEEFSRWCQLNFALYGKARLLPLVELVCDANKIKRQQRAELLDAIDALARDYAA